jgi:3-oxoacyl-[acyl-carrier protein] reductase
MSNREQEVDAAISIGRTSRQRFNAKLFEEKTVIVTGGSRGIGRACSVTFAALGAKVAFSYSSNSDAADVTADAIQQVGLPPIVKRIDLSDFEGARAAIRDIADEAESVDILVNNGGIGINCPMSELSSQLWHQAIDTNFKGVYACTQEAVRVMKQKGRGGKIVNISSLATFVGLPGNTAYAASKAGIIGMSRSLAREVAADNIQVNAIAPGFIATDMTAGLDGQMREQLIAGIPAGRAGLPQDVAWAVVFLASPLSSYITGETMIVDGGVLTR